MANPHKGEFALNVGDRTFTLFLGTNASAELESMSQGRTLDQVRLSIKLRRSVADIRLFLWAALRKHHSDIAVDGQEGLRRVGDMLDEWCADDAVVAAIQALIGLNSDPGQQEATQRKSGKGNPQKARVGTGGRSTVKHLRSA